MWGQFREATPNFSYARIKKRVQGKSKTLILGGRRVGDRTRNPRLRRPVLYPIELLARALFYSSVE